MGEKQSLSPFAVALTEARLARALSIDETAKATLLSDKQILGLESDDYSYFYNVSFGIRSAETYATFLGVDLSLEGAPSRGTLDPVPLVTSVDQTSSPIKHHKLIGGRSGLLSALAVVIVFLLAYMLLPFDKNERADRAVERASESNDISSPVIGNQSQSIEPIVKKDDSIVWDRDAKENRFFIVVNKQTWISAKDSLNTSLIDGVQKPTTGTRVVGKKPFTVVVEDAEAVEIYYLGNRVRPDGKIFPGILVTVRR